MGQSKIEEANTASRKVCTKDKTKRTPSHNYNTQGNLALKTSPQSANERKNVAKKNVVATQINNGLANSFGFGFTLIVCAAIFVMLKYFISYISLTASSLQKSKEITKLTAELAAVTQENNILEENISNGIDYDYIYDAATNELGMIYPHKNQVIYYDKSDELYYVEQYKTINESGEH